MASTHQKIAALQQVARTSPEYADIIPLFVALYEYVSGREGETGISVELMPSVPGAHAEKPVPLLNSAALRVDRQLTVAFLLGVIDILAAKGQENGDLLALIGAALRDGTILPDTIYRAILERDRAPINDIAAALAIPSPLVEFIFEIPLKTALERFSAGCAAEQFAGWEQGVCPVCGSRAGMAELVGEEGRRLLSCSACSFSWPFKRLTCVYCGCDDPGKLSYFTAGEGATRVDTCKGCSRYIKTRDSRTSAGNIPLEIEDLMTIHLDLLATREGFERGK